MPVKNDLGFKVRSRGFDIIRDKEKADGKPISIDSYVEQSKLSRGTVRKFFDKKDEDVTGVSIGAVCEIAGLLGVDVFKLVYVDTGKGDPDAS